MPTAVLMGVAELRMNEAGQMRALVVDDNAYARAFCSVALNQFGIEGIEEAPNGAEAILKLLDGQFDLVLMDWYMPDITGAGVLQVLRDARFGRGATTPVILMTAYPSSDNFERARLLAVDAILPKPFSRADLGRTLARILPQRATAGEIAYV